MGQQGTVPSAERESSKGLHFLSVFQVYLTRGPSTITLCTSKRTAGGLCLKRRGTCTSPRWSRQTWATTPASSRTGKPGGASGGRPRPCCSAPTVRRWLVLGTGSRGLGRSAEPWASLCLGGRHIVSELSSAHKCDENQVLSKMITENSAIRPNGPECMILDLYGAVSPLRWDRPSRQCRGSTLWKLVSVWGAGVCVCTCRRCRVDSSNRCIFNDRVTQLLFNASFFPTFVFFCSPSVYLTGDVGGGGNDLRRKESKPALTTSVAEIHSHYTAPGSVCQTGL